MRYTSLSVPHNLQCMCEYGEEVPHPCVQHMQRVRASQEGLGFLTSSTTYYAGVVHRKSVTGGGWVF